MRWTDAHAPAHPLSAHPPSTSFPSGPRRLISSPAVAFLDAVYSDRSQVSPQLSRSCAASPCSTHSRYMQASAGGHRGSAARQLAVCDLCEDLDDIRFPERFGEELVHPGSYAYVVLLWRSVGGESDNGREWEGHAQNHGCRSPGWSLSHAGEAMVPLLLGARAVTAAMTPHCPYSPLLPPSPCAKEGMHLLRPHAACRRVAFVHPWEPG